MQANSKCWSQIQQLCETVNANGERAENLKAAVIDFRAMKPADQSLRLLQLNVALLALKELSLLIAPHIGAA